MVRLAVGIVTYNDRPALERCLNSLYDHVDIIFVIDGRYPSYGKPTDPHFSTDGTEKLCRSLPKIKYTQFSAEQNVKRSDYLRWCKMDWSGEFLPPIDYLLVVDADDYAHKDSDWDTFHKYLDNNQETFEQLYRDTAPPTQIYNIKFIMQPGITAALGRLIYKPYELHYISHWRLARNDTNEEVYYPKQGPMIHRHRSRRAQPPIPGLLMSSDDLTRPYERLKTDIDYQWNLLLKEGTITEEKYNNPEEKRKFADSILNEVYVWEKHYGKVGDKLKRLHV